LLGEKDDLSAVGTFREVREGGKALVFGESEFDEGAELVWVEVLAGLEDLAHDCFGSALFV
jgi:hypothetical protein